MQNLPISLQSFREIREEDRLYVDKTEYIHRLLSDGRYYFLARPPRFGKTILLSAIEEFFAGNRDYFRGLYLGDVLNDQKRHPVIYLDFKILDSSSSVALREDLAFVIKKIAFKENLAIKGASPGALMTWLIEALQIKYHQKVVVLIDNSDWPVSLCLLDGKRAAQNSVILRDFFGVLRSLHPRLRFILVTGVLKFSEMSKFAGLSFLTDISLAPRYGEICGISSNELTKHYGPRLEEILDLFRSLGVLDYQAGISELIQEIVHWYGGYSFDGESKLLNPNALNLFLENASFDHYWYQSLDTHTISTLFSKKLSKLKPPRDLFFTKGELKEVYVNSPESFPFLFQMGLLTLQEKSLEKGVLEYSLGFPNYEAESGLYTSVLAKLTNMGNYAVRSFIRDFRFRVENGDVLKLGQILSDFLAGLDPGKVDPSGYPLLFYLILDLAGFRFRPEVETPYTVESILKTQGGLSSVLTLQYLPADNYSTPGERKRLLADKLSDIFAKNAEPLENSPPQGIFPEFKEIYLFVTGLNDCLGGCISRQGGLIFRPLTKAEED
jgi:hypothetical protein